MFAYDFIYMCWVSLCCEVMGLNFVWSGDNIYTTVLDNSHLYSFTTITFMRMRLLIAFLGDFCDPVSSLYIGRFVFS